MTLLVFHLEISGKDFNKEQLSNTEDIFVILEISQLEISGNFFNDKQL